MKQKWKFHQRWRRRYFRLKGHKLYYSKDADEVCILKSLEKKFQIIFRFFEITLKPNLICKIILSGKIHIYSFFHENVHDVMKKT